MNASDHLDFSFDEGATGEFFRAIEAMDRNESRFTAAVPPHIRPEAIAHWDSGELY